MNRRSFLSSAAAAATLAGMDGFTSPLFAQTTPSLKSVANACGLKVGVASNKGAISSGNYGALISSNFNLLTPEGEMKWGAIHPAADRYDFSGADWLLDFATRNGMHLRGHNLCWNTGNPAWLTQTINPGNAESLLTSHIETVAGRYKGKLDSWDVVNEPLALWFNKPGGLYPGPWLDNLGPQYMDIAFHTCASVDPNTPRVLNVHHVEHAGDGKTRADCLALLESLKKRNVPVQVLGIESHLDASLPLDQGALQQFVASVKSMGISVYVTELDVNDTKIIGPLINRDQIVADMYQRYLDVMLPATHMKELVFWSLTDHSWMDYMKAPQWVRADGTNIHRPGLFGTDLQSKPALNSVEQAIQRACR